MGREEWKMSDPILHFCGADLENIRCISASQERSEYRALDLMDKSIRR